jgi:hypothetical protein
VFSDIRYCVIIRTSNPLRPSSIGTGTSTVRESQFSLLGAESILSIVRTTGTNSGFIFLPSLWKERERESREVDVSLGSRVKKFDPRLPTCPTSEILLSGENWRHGARLCVRARSRRDVLS